MEGFVIMRRKTYSMDMDWRFRKEVSDNEKITTHDAVYNKVKTGNAVGPATKRAYDDSEWERVDLPHDYIRESEFSEDAIGNHGYRVLYDGWYRKTFSVDSSLKGSHALLVFDGISTSSIVYLNGSIMERSFSGYSEIAIDVTDRLYYDRINTLAVFTKGDDIEGWWYEGAGIYRHVNLCFKHPVHIAHNGIFAKPLLKDGVWIVELETTIENSDYESSNVRLNAHLYHNDEQVAGVTDAFTVQADGRTVSNTVMAVDNPMLWDVDNPELYRLEVQLVKDDEIIDCEETNIGFRTFSMDPEKGFILNGRTLKIKGTCNHQDHAGVGVAVPDSVQYYRVRRLKEMGCNAYRCAHNPPAREILDACDKLGLIVMDENRTFETRPDAIKNLETLIRRDRNHPSVMFYSIFNEEPLQNSSEGAAIFRRLKNVIKRLDDTRLILGAINDTMHADGTGKYMDVFGRNYGLPGTVDIRTRFPDMPIIGSETNSAVTTRGCYVSDREVKQVLNGYDEEIVPWGATVRDNWKFVRENNYMAGIFVWTGFDYRGEPTPFKWPSCSSQFGVMDTCGFEKDAYYFTQAVFLDKPMMYILPHWNYNEGDVVRVMTVTNCEEVELFLNGQSLGRRESDPCVQNEWEVKYVPGCLSAIGYRDGKAVVTYERKTAGKPHAIKLVPDRNILDNCGQDTVPIRVSVVDKDGIELPEASNKIEFEVLGDGVIVGVGNGDPNSHEPEHVSYRKLYCGLCQVLVKANLGAKNLTLIASGDGLESAQVEFGIENKKSPEYISFKPNYTVDRILTSVEDSEQKPDPSHVYGNDDMNSFSPLVLENGFNAFAPPFFEKGWRQLRIFVNLPANIPEGKNPVLMVQSVICEKAEFYIDGRVIYEEEPEVKASLAVPLITDKKQFEVRMLMKAKENAQTNGIALGITLSFV